MVKKYKTVPSEEDNFPIKIGRRYGGGWQLARDSNQVIADFGQPEVVVLKSAYAVLFIFFGTWLNAVNGQKNVFFKTLF